MGSRETNPKAPPRRQGAVASTARAICARAGPGPKQPAYRIQDGALGRRDRCHVRRPCSDASIRTPLVRLINRAGGPLAGLPPARLGKDLGGSADGTRPVLPPGAEYDSGNAKRSPRPRVPQDHTLIPFIH